LSVEPEPKMHGSGNMKGEWSANVPFPSKEDR